MGKKKHKKVGLSTEKEQPKENFIVRMSNEADDLKLLDPFIDDKGMEGFSRFDWVVRKMAELRKGATKQELTVARWMYSERIKYVTQAPFRIFTPEMGSHCYFTDFYIPALGVIVEIDGSQHHTPEGLAYDHNRDEAFERIGIKTIRIPNRQVSNGEFKTMIPIPAEEFLMPKRIIHLPEGLSGISREQKIAMAKKLLGHDKRGSGNTE